MSNTNNLIYRLITRSTTALSCTVYKLTIIHIMYTIHYIPSERFSLQTDFRHDTKLQHRQPAFASLHQVLPLPPSTPPLLVVPWYHHFVITHFCWYTTTIPAHHHHHLNLCQSVSRPKLPSPLLVPRQLCTLLDLSTLFLQQLPGKTKVDFPAFCALLVISNTTKM